MSIALPRPHAGNILAPEQKAIAIYYFDHIFDEYYSDLELQHLARLLNVDIELLKARLEDLKQKNINSTNHNEKDIRDHIVDGAFPEDVEILRRILLNPKPDIQGSSIKNVTNNNDLLTEIYYRELLGARYTLNAWRKIRQSPAMSRHLSGIRNSFVGWVESVIKLFIAHTPSLPIANTNRNSLGSDNRLNNRTGTSYRYTPWFSRRPARMEKPLYNGNASPHIRGYAGTSRIPLKQPDLGNSSSVLAGITMAIKRQNVSTKELEDTNYSSRLLHQFRVLIKSTTFIPLHKIDNIRSVYYFTSPSLLLSRYMWTKLETQSHKKKDSLNDLLLQINSQIIKVLKKTSKETRFTLTLVQQKNHNLHFGLFWSTSPSTDFTERHMHPETPDNSMGETSGSNIPLFMPLAKFRESDNPNLLQDWLQHLPPQDRENNDVWLWFPGNTPNISAFISPSIFVDERRSVSSLKIQRLDAALLDYKCRPILPCLEKHHPSKLINRMRHEILGIGSTAKPRLCIRPSKSDSWLESSTSTKEEIAVAALLSQASRSYTQ
ncbi:hypothetical protein H4219_003288 [Mycoemilia scoparia]|uniref:Uncharacterized protein n=1 Tax=Mycoemilia scoparia TaxID=417184 RepID=A0A9W8A1M6_9FUNG|nr:hypothetical protein H4219_003288 [Mycoemilia scoparia]